MLRSNLCQHSNTTDSAFLVFRYKVASVRLVSEEVNIGQVDLGSLAVC